LKSVWRFRPPGVLKWDPAPDTTYTLTENLRLCCSSAEVGLFLNLKQK